MNLKELFPGYRSPHNDQIASWWRTGLFVLDTNVILDFYRYSNPTRSELLEILGKLSTRLWIPNQAALEFIKNRPDVILTQVGMYDKAKKIISDLETIAKEEVRKNLTFQNHPFIDKDKLLEKLNNSFADLTKELDRQKSSHPDLLNDDPILGFISDLFGENIGEPYSADKLKDIFKIGDARYNKHIPPGYMDAEGQQKKDGDEKYGDLILWLQIIDKARTWEKPVILITNDKKEDWWWITKGKTIGPRPELIGEMLSDAKVNFYMYNTDRFMVFAREYLDVQVRQESIDEIRDVILQKEEESRSLEKYVEPEFPPELDLFELIRSHWREISHYVKQKDTNVAALLNSGKLYGFKDDSIIIAYMSDILQEKVSRNVSLVEDAIVTTIGVRVGVKFIVVDKNGMPDPLRTYPRI